MAFLLKGPILNDRKADVPVGNLHIHLNRNRFCEGFLNTDLNLLAAVKGLNQRMNVIRKAFIIYLNFNHLSYPFSYPR